VTLFKPQSYLLHLALSAINETFISDESSREWLRSKFDGRSKGNLLLAKVLLPRGEAYSRAKSRFGTASFLTCWIPSHLRSSPLPNPEDATPIFKEAGATRYREIRARHVSAAPQSNLTGDSVTNHCGTNIYDETRSSCDETKSKGPKTKGDPHLNAISGLPAPHSGQAHLPEFMLGTSLGTLLLIRTNIRIVKAAVNTSESSMRPLPPSAHESTAEKGFSPPRNEL